MGTIELKQFSELPWTNHFVEKFPGDPVGDNFTRIVQEVCYSEVKPTAVRSPSLMGWSENFASELGIARPSPNDNTSLELLSGNRVLTRMRPYSARYGGHQFGHWAGQLGDGRAITLGEVLVPNRGRFEFQLKGAGPTPYSRRADGRAVLRSSMREFLCSEAMHSLGVPTTRALSLVLSGEQVIRDLFYNGNPAPEPGAIVCRVAPSFLRFGNFQILASNGEIDLLRKLTDFLITDYYPELNLNDADVYGKLLDEISRRTAEMIAQWMRVGFVHGVMNTDNMSVLGLTIDYGPYGWLEPYDPSWTPNTTDAENGRYRFGHQASIALWNLARLGEALYPLIKDEERIHAALAVYRDTFEKSYGEILYQKLGLTLKEPNDDPKLIKDLFALLQSAETDFTLFFRGLSNWPTEGDAWLQTIEENFQRILFPSFYSAPEKVFGAENPNPIGPKTFSYALAPKGLPGSLYSSGADETKLKRDWILWLISYSERIKREGISDIQRSRSMKKVNPKYVLRNYLAQNAIVAAEKGDISKMDRLMRVLQTPYDELPLEEDLASKRPEWARHAPGCSALSCSS